jgi:hypothetical protein
LPIVDWPADWDVVAVRDTSAVPRCTPTASFNGGASSREIPSSASIKASDSSIARAASSSVPTGSPSTYVKPRSSSRSGWAACL